MSDLPNGWTWTTVGEVASTSLGKMLDKKQATGEHPTPYLRNVNVRWGTFDLADVAQMDIRPDELDRVLARPGDVIACEGGEPGRAAVWRGPGSIALQKALHKIRPSRAVASAYLAHLLHHLSTSRQLQRLFTGTTIKHLPQEKLRLVTVPLPPRHEQERIVAAIEEYLSRLDAAGASLRAGASRLRTLRRNILGLAQASGEVVPLNDLLLDIEAGKSFKTPGRPAGPDEWGVIKVSAMTWGEFDQDENKVVPDASTVDPRYEISEGDLLLSRANTSEYVGASVLVGNTRPKLLLSDKSMRLQTRTEVDRSWLHLALSSPQIRSQMSEVATGTSDSMRNISQAKVRALRIRVPERCDQRRLADEITDALGGLESARSDLQSSSDRAASLRRSILAAAFSGRLVPQDPDDEPASVLLEHIRAERAVDSPVASARAVAHQ